MAMLSFLHRFWDLSLGSCPRTASILPTETALQNQFLGGKDTSQEVLRTFRSISFNQQDDRASGNGGGCSMPSCGLGTSCQQTLPPGPWMRVCEPYLEINEKIDVCRMRYMGSSPRTLAFGVQARKKFTKHSYGCDIYGCVKLYLCCSEIFWQRIYTLLHVNISHVRRQHHQPKSLLPCLCIPPKAPLPTCLTICSNREHIDEFLHFPSSL